MENAYSHTSSVGASSSPQNSTGKSGVQNCNPAAGGVRGSLLRNLLVLAVPG